MKKLLLIAVVSLCGLVSANAQVNQGTIFVGAGSNFGFNSWTPDEGDSFTEFDLHVKGGYFFIDNLTAGLKLDVDKADEDKRGQPSTTDLSIFGRYYLNNVIILGASIGSSKLDFGDTDASATVLGIEGGYAAFLTDNIAIEPTVNIDLYSGDYDATRFGVNVMFSLYLGRD